MFDSYASLPPLSPESISNQGAAALSAGQGHSQYGCKIPRLKAPNLNDPPQKNRPKKIPGLGLVIDKPRKV